MSNIEDIWTAFENMWTAVENISPLFQAIASIGAIATALLYWYKTQAMVQSELFQSEDHILKLCRALTDNNQRLQLAAAALLVERLDRRGKGKHLDYERHAIVQALISATIDDPTNGSEGSASLELSKFVGDAVVHSLKASTPSGRTLPAQSPLKGFYWQRCRLSGSWWKSVDARGVDFFCANLDDVGMAEAHLQSTILKNASLERATLRGAKLDKADLRDAKLMGADLSDTDLSTTKLLGAKYDRRTKFPPGFDPISAGMLTSPERVELAQS
jgi:Pentapeptide repeats (8 copies)